MLSEQKHDSVQRVKYSFPNDPKSAARDNFMSNTNDQNFLLRKQLNL